MSQSSRIKGITRLAGGESPAALLVVALLLRLAVAFLLPPPADFAWLTEPGVTAANLVAGRGYTFDFYGLRPENPLVAFVPPLHPWLIALALATPWSALAYGLLQALLGGLTVWLVWRLARAMAGPVAGALAGWAAALYPAHLLLVGQPVSTVLHAGCLAAVLLACWRLTERPAIGRALLAGALLGLLVLGRPQALALLPFLLAWLWLSWRSRCDLLLRCVAPFVLAALLIPLPWAARNSLLLGRPTFLATNGGFNFWNGSNPFTTGSGHDVYAGRLAAYQGTPPDPTLPEIYAHPWPYPLPADVQAQAAALSETELDRELWRAGLDYVRQEPDDWLQLEAQKLVSFWWFRPNLGSNPLYRPGWTALYRLQYALLATLAAAGLVLSLRQWRRYALLYLAFSFYTLVALVFHSLTRYRWEVEPLLLIPAALAVEAAGKRILALRPGTKGAR